MFDSSVGAATVVYLKICHVIVMIIKACIIINGCML